MKRIISAMAMLLTSAILMATSSYAWFSMNREVRATGMGVTAQAASSLVISNSLAVGTSSDVAFTTSTQKLIAAVHNGTSTVGLYYNTNPGSISPATGLAVTGSAVSTADVTADTDASHKYYIDYVCYVAASGGAMENATLTATLSCDSTFATAKAASIDFWVATNAATTDVYKGTLNVAGLALDNDTTYDASKTCTTVTLLDNGTVPVNNQSDTWFKVTMRCYFDGALHNSATTTYITTDTIDITQVELGVTFNATVTGE